jgi:hypothetical protein
MNQQVPQTEKKSKRTLYILSSIIIIGIIIISLFILVPFLNCPKPEIVLLDGHDGFQGFNYVSYVDVTIKNNGGGGWVTVYAEIEGAGKYEKKEQKIYIISGETKQLQFVFDISFWNALFSSLTYRAWAVAS